MPRRASLVVFLTLASAAGAEFSGARALEDTRRIVAFGPRIPGSPAMRNAQAYIVAELRKTGCAITEDAFTAQTPRGPVAMKNILCRFPGKSGKALAVSGHYDTKTIPGVRFLGANDGGSSAAFLLELARAAKDRPRQSDLWLVFFDGEEAFGEWSATDSLYGSRHLAARWQREGVLPKLKALFNVDMIGDRDLVIEREMFSSASLNSIVQDVAAKQGVLKHFAGREMPVEDDHAPFLQRGVRALDLIDFDYGPNNSWWHTAADTIDKLSPRSFEIVGKVVLEVLQRLDP